MMRDEMLTTTLQHRQGNFEYRNFQNNTGYYTLTDQDGRRAQAGTTERIRPGRARCEPDQPRLVLDRWTTTAREKVFYAVSRTMQPRKGRAVNM